ncbi:MAG: CPBP family intramembrane metalloprotease [Oscillospiraceae bacterium]|nr:CPBP family intramembrane metalloprotease [Oscillospiraceae bacterium]MBQ6402987.1 CPBP family intramembrane metalloprotease [Oscillospiraceae bacterium]
MKRFDDLMLRRERICGFVWLPIHVILLPLFLVPVLYLMLGADKLTDAGANVIYYLISFLFVIIVFWNFLRESFDRFVGNLRGAVLAMVIAYALQLVLTLGLQALMSVFGELETPNNDAINELANIEYKKIFAVAVLMAPITEEVLFRGVLFGSLARRHRWLGWVVSVAVFCLYHVWQFAVVEQDWTVLIAAAEYIPLTVAITYCYDRTQTIWTPIFFHIFTNSLALAYMTSGA